MIGSNSSVTTDSDSDILNNTGSDKDSKPWRLPPHLLKEFNEKGCFFIIPNKSEENKDLQPIKIKISQATMEQAKEISKLMVDYGDGALACGEDEDKAYAKTARQIADKLGFVATIEPQNSQIPSNNLATNSNSLVVAYQGITLWKRSKIAEPGSAVTHPEFRGLGINTIIKKLAITKCVKMHPHLDLIIFCREKSTSIGILQKIGAEIITIEEMSERWPQLAAPHGLKRREELGIRVLKLEK